MVDTDKTIVTQDERKITWGLTYKHNLGNYSNVEASIYMTDFVPKSKKVEAFLTEKTEAAFDMLKIEVYTALALDYTVDEEGHPTVDKPAAPVPGPAAPPPAPANGPAPAPSSRPSTGQQPSMAQVGYYPDTPAFCKDCGNREFYDNRTEIDNKVKAGQKIGPDFKCKECNKGVWRPRSFDYNEALKQAAQGNPQGSMAPPTT